MLKTQIDLPLKTRKTVAEVANARLAQLLDLQLAVKHAHWNVRGVHFIGLHELFDKLYTELAEPIDVLAERIGQLGFLANGTLESVKKNSTLKPYPAEIIADKDHLKALQSTYAQVAKDVRSAIDACDKADDKDSADLFTDLSRIIDKQLWFIEAHLQA